MIATKKPTYSDDCRMNMTAYLGPRRGGKRFFGGIYGVNPRDPQETYPSFICDDVFQLYKDAGFNFVMPEGDAYYGMRITQEGLAKEPVFERMDLFQYMQLAEKYGLDVYPTMEELFGEMTHMAGPFGEQERKKIYDFVKTIAEQFPKTFKGIMLTDEPRYVSLERIKAIVDYLHSEEIQTIKPDLDIFSAMLPMYGAMGAFHPDYDIPEYHGHCRIDIHRQKAYQSYIEKCSEAVGEFCYDFYPLGRDGWLSPGFYLNLEMAAQYGLEHDIPIAITLQSFRMDTNYNVKTGRGRVIFRSPNYEDIRWQVYSALAFGVQRIAYFTFWQHYSESEAEVFNNAMVMYDPSEECGYRVTGIYDAVKKVNEEILSMDHVFLRFKWKGCRVVRTSRERNIRLVKGGYEGGCLKKLEANKDTLVGCFEQSEDATEGYWIVNAENSYRHQMNDIRVLFEGATNLLYYRKGKEYDVPLAEGSFEIRLGVGEGIFVIPYHVN